MSKPVKILFITLIIIIVLLLVTWLVPDVNTYAKSLVSDKWPIWLVGIAAPILFLLKKIKDGLVNLIFPGGRIGEENEVIKRERNELRKDVDELLNWRRSALKKEVAELEKAKARLLGHEEDLNRVDAEISRVESTPDSRISEPTRKTPEEHLSDSFNAIID